MKKIKISVFAVIAIIMGIAGSAFTQTNRMISENPSQSSYWFLMNPAGTQVTTEQVTDPSQKCPKRINPDCARLYDEIHTEIVGGVRQVKLGEENLYRDFRSKN